MYSKYVCGGALALALTIGGTAAIAKPGDKIEGSYICVFKAGSVARGNVRSEAARAAGNGVKHVYENSIRGFSANGNSAAALAARNPHIAYCEQDQEVVAIQSGGPLDFRVLGKPGAPSQPPQSTPWGVTRVKGGAGTGSGGGTAWVIDTGIDFDHPDLNVDVARSRTFVDRTDSADDQNGHGTHVAGTIAAKNDTAGVVGVAAGATVVAVRVLDRRGSGAYSWIIAGVDYVAGAASSGDVANMSLGGPASGALDDAVRNAAGNGVTFALAAGNESTDAGTRSPARVNAPNVYTISASDSGDGWAWFSNYGSPVDYAAPGVSVLSTWKNGGYDTISGTSMASPHVAGILLLGSINADGTVSGDPDGSADPIAHR